ncbi:MULTISPECIES: hypothetical protein [unclassified Bradyrhizobium]|uniref:hypothetical protein n=1 Tax=unclassified Bradyrhizobium TaxID=2631580 RepID=UPI0020B2DD84|nr:MULTISPECIES: hypothetical protein [unclassified Bradyrhizobium]MCP3396930.1 hypothetical protein [Bradyrhizobium sp. CCGB20]MCP3405446.1 hypothetical protein [Bradyrhizobium sp. CCGB01]
MTSIIQLDRLLLMGVGALRDQFDGSIGVLTTSSANGPDSFHKVGSLGSATAMHFKDCVCVDAGSPPNSQGLPAMIRTS